MRMFSNHMDVKDAALLRNETGEDVLVLHLKIPGRFALNPDAPEALARAMPGFSTTPEEVASQLPWVKADPVHASVTLARIDDFLASQGLPAIREPKDGLRIIMPTDADKNIGYELKLIVKIKDSPQKALELAGALAEEGLLKQHVTLAEVQARNGNIAIQACASDLRRFLIGLNHAATPPEMRSR